MKLGNGYRCGACAELGRASRTGNRGIHRGERTQMQERDMPADAAPGDGAPGDAAPGSSDSARPGPADAASGHARPADPRAGPDMGHDPARGPCDLRGVGEPPDAEPRQLGQHEHEALAERRRPRCDLQLPGQPALRERQRRTGTQGQAARAAGPARRTAVRSAAQPRRRSRQTRPRQPARAGSVEAGQPRRRPELRHDRQRRQGSGRDQQAVRSRSTWPWSSATSPTASGCRTSAPSCRPRSRT